VIAALLLGYSTSLGEELSPEVTTPLQEFKVKRLAIEKKAEAETDKELQTLIKKLEKVSKGKNKMPQANEQATQLLEKLKSPTFLATGLNELIDDTQVGVSVKAAEMITVAYNQKRVTVEEWAALPGDAIEVTARERKDTGIDVKPGDRVLVCPHPIQKWRKQLDRDWSTYDGRLTSGHIDFRQELIGRIISPTNQDLIELKNGLLFRGSLEGRLYLEPRERSDAGQGAVECKVFKVNAR